MRDTVRHCRVCGCTDDRACLLDDDPRFPDTCYWLNDEHCSNPICAEVKYGERPLTEATRAAARSAGRHNAAARQLVMPYAGARQ